VVISAATALLDRAGVTPLEVFANLASKSPLDDLVANDAPELDAAELQRLAAPPGALTGGSGDEAPDVT
jgi:hypothetical protein